MKTTRRELFGAMAGLLGLGLLPRAKAEPEEETFEAMDEMWDRLEFDPAPAPAWPPPTFHGIPVYRMPALDSSPRYYLIPDAFVTEYNEVIYLGRQET